jgi:hypothetical protein
VPLRFTTSPYFGRRRATERVEAGSAHLLGQPSGPPTALGDEWDWAPGLFYRTDLGRATTSRCIVRLARGRVIFAWRHGQRDESSMRKLAIRIREKITQARRISRVVMTADARAVLKDAYETLSQGRPGLPGERRSLLLRRPTTIYRPALAISTSRYLAHSSFSTRPPFGWLSIAALAHSAAAAWFG